MQHAPVVKEAFGIATAYRTAFEAEGELSRDNPVIMLPEGHEGPFKIAVRGAVTTLDTYLGDLECSAGAVALFNMGLRYTKRGRLTTIYGEDEGQRPAVVIRAPDGVNEWQIKEGIQKSVTEIGKGWERDGDGFRKIFPANDPSDPSDLANDRQAQRMVLDGIVQGSTAGPSAVEAVFLDAAGERVSSDKADEDWGQVKQIALRISCEQAAMVSEALGVSIGIQK